MRNLAEAPGPGREWRTSRTFRFGVFELDPRAGELRKQGMKIKLQGQPVQILVMLLERPGEIVTREELQKKLWPADTFVDFEQGLNNAMKRLRAALDDDAESPRFIETLPRRGYRFVGSLNGSGNSSATQGKTTHSAGVLLPRTAFGALAVLIVAAVLVGMNFHGWRDRLFARSPKPQIQALAVLPLANLSGDPEQEYFADGMTEALITELGRVASPRVISRQSVMQYKGSKKSLQEIAGELKVDAVLEGTVARSGDRVRVTMHLSQAAPEGQLWAQEYNRSLRDVLTLQGEIARSVIDEIQVKLSPEEQARLTSARPVNPEAHDNYLMGMYQWNKATTGPELETAIRYFELATEKDPGYARPYVGLADAYRDLGHPANVGGRPSNETLPKARVAALKALDLDPSLGEAHTSVATLLAASWDWPGAEKEFRLGVELAPNYAPGHAWYGGYLASLGRNDEALAQYNYAMELDPDSYWYRIQRANALLISGRYDLATKEYDALEEYWGVGMAFMMRQMYPEAITAVKKSIEHTGRRDPMNLGLLAEIYGLAGSKPEARRLLDELKEKAKRVYVAPTTFAQAYIGLGDRKTAVDWMEQAYEDGDEMMSLAKVGPVFAPLRSEPRFQALLRRMNFPE